MAHRIRRASGLVAVFFALGLATTAVAQQAPVFTYYGDVFQSDGVSPAPSSYRVVIANTTQLDTVVADVGVLQSGKYQVTVVDLSGGSVVSVGDQIEVTLTDGDGAVLVDPIVTSITLAHIAEAGLRTDLVPEPPVSVAVTSSQVEHRHGAVDVRWTLSEEAEELPFALYRRSLPDGSYEIQPRTGIARVGVEYRYRDENLVRGETYEYLLEIDGGERLGFVLGRVLVPVGLYRLEQNYPNPFNPTTRIRFETDAQSRVTLIIYDVSGRAVRTLIADQVLDANSHTLEWNGLDDGGNAVVSGVYFLCLVADGKPLTRRMVLLK